MPRGWFVPVTPGTRQVTVGGAIAADIHGKNHHVDGSFCSHVRRLTLATPTGVHTVDPGSDPELFWATAGAWASPASCSTPPCGMIPVETSYCWSTPSGPRTSTTSWADGSRRRRLPLLGGLDRLPGHGRRLGRAVLTRGDHARLADLPPGLAASLPGPRFVPRQWPRVPLTPPSGLLNPLSVGAFNELWFRKAPGAEVGQPQPHRPASSTRSTGSANGTASTAARLPPVPVRRALAPRRDRAPVIERLSEARLASFLAVLKRFGPGAPARSRSPCPAGPSPWTCRSAPTGSAALLDALDEEVLGAGGRVYLAKDSRLAPDLFRAMYPRLDEFQEVKRRVDPDGVLHSDLARRLGLCADAGPAAARARAGRRARRTANHHHGGRTTMNDATGAPVSARARRSLRDRPGLWPASSPGRCRTVVLAGRRASASTAAGGRGLGRRGRRGGDRGLRHHRPGRAAGAVDAVFDRFGDIDLVLAAAGVLGDQADDRADPAAAATLITTNFTGLAAALLAVAAGCAPRATAASS